MISGCSNADCQNIFQHQRGTVQIFCCKACRKGLSSGQRENDHNYLIASKKSERLKNELKRSPPKPKTEEDKQAEHKCGSASDALRYHTEAEG